MPVTARLSKKFYEQFGDEIAGEFVDWFNAVDSTYQQQLRDLNDLNWERFRAELDARFAQFGAQIDARFAQIDGRFAQIDGRLLQVESKFTPFEAQLTEKLTRMLSEMKSELMKWMFIYWSGTVISLGGLIIVLLRNG